jgi:hypothetical protein
MADKTYRYKLEPLVTVVHPTDGNAVTPTWTNGVNIPTIDTTVDESLKTTLDEAMAKCGWVFDQEVI